MRFFLLSVCILISFFSNIALGSSVDNDKLITVIFRFDDPSSVSNMEIEKKVIELFDDVGKKCTFAVVPNHTTGDVRSVSSQDRKPLGLEKGDFFSQAVENGAIDIALHGYTHQTVVARQSIKYATEFAGLNFHEQQKKVQSGKKMLEERVGTSISIFVPPFNTYDFTTLSVLESANFFCISNDSTGRVPLWTKLKILPTTCRITELKEVVEVARKEPDLKPLIAVLFHEYDFTDVNPKNGRLSFVEFESIVRWAAEQTDVKILSVGQAVDSDEDLGSKRFFLNFSLPDILPSFLKLGDKRIFYSASYANKAMFYCIVFYLLVLIFFIFVSYMFSVYLLPFFKKYACVLVWAAGGLCLFLAIFSFHDLEIYCKGLVLLIATLGIFLGMLIAYLKVSSQRTASEVVLKNWTIG